jgi:hypothetical protein
LARRLNRSGPLITLHQLDRAAFTDRKLFGGLAPGQTRTNTRNDPLPKIQRITFAHGSPPVTVDHCSAEMGIPLDSRIRRDALDRIYNRPALIWIVDFTDKALPAPQDS